MHRIHTGRSQILFGDAKLLAKQVFDPLRQRQRIQPVIAHQIGPTAAMGVSVVQAQPLQLFARFCRKYVCIWQVGNVVLGAGF